MFTRRSVELIIEAIAGEAGVKANNQKVTPHKLRHTCATVLYNEGEVADLLAIADLLGNLAALLFYRYKFVSEPRT
ncbi:tyrosine-type recombinase/integrase [Paenibacillus sp. NPDC093718]|uniref:tyrosine-type recombinase/integrase n=1 Tax=Paenibacillus sp. NPDC093718 TaxID=3390601 RepID=UPI003D088CD1